MTDPDIVSWYKMLSRCTSSVLLSFCCLYACVSAERIYINEWIVEVKGRPEFADEIARRHGFRNLGKVDQYYYNIYIYIYIYANQDVTQAILLERGNNQSCETLCLEGLGVYSPRNFV